MEPERKCMFVCVNELRAASYSNGEKLIEKTLVIFHCEKIYAFSHGNHKHFGAPANSLVFEHTFSK